MKKLLVLAGIVFMSGLLMLALIVNVQLGMVSMFKQRMTALFFKSTQSPQILKQNYKAKKLRVLIAAGHDNISTGTYFNGINESELTLDVSNKLAEFFKEDPRFITYVTRTDSGYTPELKKYFTENRSSIKNFRNYARRLFYTAKESGKIKTNNSIDHVNAGNETALKLYGINKWANENNINIMIHPHFNDYPGRHGRHGKYSGFSVYYPEQQLPNNKVSKGLARSIYYQLYKAFPMSSLPMEQGGPIESQDLIAIGANGSLDSASILIEYGYIYEPQFTRPALREAVMKNLAYQTYLGVKKYFKPSIISDQQFQTTYLPHTWSVPLKKGIKSNLDVLALQATLLEEGLYPPKGRTFTNCPMSGTYGPCTQAAVKSFQEKHREEILAPVGLNSGTGYTGPSTIRKLNELYSNI